MIANFVASYPGKWALGSAVVCGLTTTEMLSRACADLISMKSNDEGQRKAYDFSGNLGGALFYGLCAANIVPYTAFGGAAIYTVYSLFKGGGEGRIYFCLGSPKNIIPNGVLFGCPSLGEHCCSCFRTRH